MRTYNYIKGFHNEIWNCHDTDNNGLAEVSTENDFVVVNQDTFRREPSSEIIKY